MGHISHRFLRVGTFFALSLIMSTHSRADDFKSTQSIQPVTDKTRRYSVSDSKTGIYMGATSSSSPRCIPGEAPDPVRGLTVGCTFRDKQKPESLGRQIATAGFDHIINFVWFNQDNNSGTGSHNIRYEAFDPSIGALGDGTGGVDVFGCDFFPCNVRSSVIDAALDGTTVIALNQNRTFPAPGNRFKTSVAKNQTPSLGDFVGGEVDTLMGDTILTGNATGFKWPKVAFSGNSATGVSHLVISSDRTDGANPGLYTRKVRGGSWEPGPSFGKAGYNQSFVIAASRQSDRVAIAWSGGRGDGTEFGASLSRFNNDLSGKNDNDIYVMTSEDAGLT